MDPDSEMMQAIEVFAEMVDDPVGCTVCHGGDPKGQTRAHAGSQYPGDARGQGHG